MDRNICFLLSFVLLDTIDHPSQLLGNRRPGKSDSFSKIFSLLHLIYKFINEDIDMDIDIGKSDSCATILSLLHLID